MKCRGSPVESEMARSLLTAGRKSSQSAAVDGISSPRMQMFITIQQLHRLIASFTTEQELQMLRPPPLTEDPQRARLYCRGVLVTICFTQTHKLSGRVLAIQAVNG